MQRPIPDTKQKGLQRRRALLPQPVCSGEGVIGHGPAPAAHVDGDVLPVVAGFDLRLDIPVVDLATEASAFLPGPALPGGIPLRSSSVLLRGHGPGSNHSTVGAPRDTATSEY